MSRLINDRALIVVMGTLMASISLTGCMESSDIDLLPDPGALDAPKWKPGQTWHYVSPEGMWQNWTVEAIEQVRNYTTYKVRIDLNEPDDFGVSTYLQWHDLDLLGLVAFRQSSFHGESDPPARQLFPMLNRSYEVQGDVIGYQMTETMEHIIHGWDLIEVKGTELWAVNITTNTNDTHFSGLQDGLITEPHYAWYSPSVENYVKWTSYYEEYTLAEWSKPGP